MWPDLSSTQDDRHPSIGYVIVSRRIDSSPSKLGGVMSMVAPVVNVVCTQTHSVCHVSWYSVCGSSAAGEPTQRRCPVRSQISELSTTSATSSLVASSRSVISNDELSS